MTSQHDIFLPMIQQQIGGYEFKNPMLLRQAFVRRSFTVENGGENNEVLEFIGDKVLDMVVIMYLTEKFRSPVEIPDIFRTQNMQEYKCELSEGELTKIKQKLVEKRYLAKRIDELGLSQFLLMGEGDKKNQIAKEDSVKEDIFEAILGAVALDCNWQFETLKSVGEIMLSPDSVLADGKMADYVGLIYEWDAKKKTVPLFWYPNYGFSAAMYRHDPYTIYQPLPKGNLSRLTCACRLKLLNGVKVFEGYGSSKHEARKAVCEFAYKYLEDHDMLFDIHDEIENPNLEDSINQLEILARRGYFELPKYVFKESHDDNGNPIWHVECHIEGMRNHYSAEGSSKRNTKKEVAFKMLSYILDLEEE